MILYALTVFIGAFLLFLVQPLIGKYILPWFGGTPAVWTTCMLFFQTLLLAGYAYAHVLIRRFRLRTQVVVHLTLLGAAILVLPIQPGEQWKPTSAGAGDPRLHILALLTVCLGLPYAVLSATGPLLQGWFSIANPDRSPYRLYALSNVGSLLALIAYPFVVEPNLPRLAQAGLWSAGMVLYVLMCASAAVSTARSETRASAGAHPGPDGTSPGAAWPGTWLLWFLLPMCASVLLLAVTNKICQDVSVVPFLWVLPLGLYLLSFAVSFDSPRWYRRPFWLPALAAALLAVSWAMIWAGRSNVVSSVVTYVVALAACCMVCHGELYRLKPGPAHLTSFYLMIAAGGAAGGLFVALVAPSIFTYYFELHWGLFACGLLLILVLVRERLAQVAARRPGWARTVAGWALASAGLAGFGWVLVQDATEESDAIVFRARSFYGVLTVLHDDEDDRRLFLLRHGGTLHGVQYQGKRFDQEPAAYYGRRSGIGVLLRLLPEPAPRRIGVIGLGVGTLASYGRPGDYFRIYEIDPLVSRVAEEYFSFLRESQAQVDVVLGDGRLSLEREPPQQFDVLVLDAFSSDSVPVHLLTREAFETYRRHVRSDGVIALHVSNRFLNLRPVVQRIAEHFHYDLAHIDRDHEKEAGQFNSTWMLLTNNQELLSRGDLRASTSELEPPDPRLRMWTDEDSNLFRIVKF